MGFALVRSIFALQVVWLGVTQGTCPQEYHTCCDKWQLVYENDLNGARVAGNRYALLAAILAGSRVRVRLGDYIAEADGIYVHGGHAHAELLQHVSKANWKNFQNNAYWWWTMVATTGLYQNIRYNVGSSQKRGDSLSKTAAKWYVKSSYSSNTAVYANNKAGAAVSGSLGNLKSAVQDGLEIRALTDSYQFPLQNIAYDAAKVSGQFVDHISKTSTSSTIKFVSGSTLPYWWFTIISSSGKRDMSRWTVGEHQSRGHSSDTVATEWFSDPCWELVYSHSNQGTGTYGSLSALVSKIRSGHRVRVQLLNGHYYTTEADNLSILGGHVTAQALKHVSKASMDRMQDNAYWWWIMVSTTGTVRMTRYNIGEHVDRGSTKSAYAVRWFVDSRPWTPIFSHGSSGNTLSGVGSRAALVNAVRQGAAVRIVQSDGAYAFVAQNLQVGPAGKEVAAQTLNSVSMQLAPGGKEMMIQHNAYWWFTIVTTRGQRDMSRWTVGDHVNRGRSHDRVALNWFVQM